MALQVIIEDNLHTVIKFQHNYLGSGESYFRIPLVLDEDIWFFTLWQDKTEELGKPATIKSFNFEKVASSGTFYNCTCAVDPLEEFVDIHFDYYKKTTKNMTGSTEGGTPAVARMVEELANH